VAAEAAVGVGPGEALCRLKEREPLLGQLFAGIRDPACSPHNSGACCAIADYFGVDGIIPLLLHGPVDAVRVGLLLCEEELLSPVQGRLGEFVCACMQMSGMDGAATASRAQQLRACRVLVDHDKGGDLRVVGDVCRDLEHVADAVFLEVGTLPGSWVDAWLRTCRRGGLPFVLFLSGYAGDLFIDVVLH